jgi:hypothetical protein
VFNRTPCGSPRLALHFILGQARAAARRRLTLTLGQTVRSPDASPSLAIAAAAAGRCLRPSPAPTTRRVGRASGGQAQAKDARNSSLASSHPKDDCNATRGKHIGPQSSAVQFMVRASRDIAAPGNQLVVVRGARACGADGAGGGARMSQQPKLMRGRHNARTVGTIKFSASRPQTLGLTLRSTGHLAAARA